MNVDCLLISVRFGLDCIMLIMGLILLLRARGNRMQKIAGIVVSAWGVCLMIESIYYFLQPENSLSFESEALFSPFSMVKWYLYIYLFSLFPVMLLHFGQYNVQRLWLFTQPLIIAGVIYGCFKWLDISFTPIRNIADIQSSINYPDVQMRLIIFSLSVIIPTFNLLLYFIEAKSPHIETIGMKFYIISLLVMQIFYILDTTTSFAWIHYMYGYVLVCIPIVFSIFILKTQNSSFLLNDKEQQKSSNAYLLPTENIQIGYSSPTEQLYHKMMEEMKQHLPFISPNYNSKQLVEVLNTNHALLNKAIQYGGFTGFREFINHLRMEHFKHLVRTMPGASIKELMFRCGFTSRSSFYRHFAAQENISPKEYLDRLYRNQGKASLT